MDYLAIAKEKKKEMLDTDAKDIWDYPAVKIIAYVTLTVAGIYIIGKSMRVLGGAVKDVKYFVKALNE